MTKSDYEITDEENCKNQQGKSSNKKQSWVNINIQENSKYLESKLPLVD